MGQEIQFMKDELKELQLAYALTVCKPQGRQAPIVMTPVSTSHYMMLARNWIFTGMTRAGGRRVFIGTKKAIRLAVYHHKVSQRNTNLAERIVYMPMMHVINEKEAFNYAK